MRRRSNLEGKRTVEILDLLHAQQLSIHFLEGIAVRTTVYYRYIINY